MVRAALALAASLAAAASAQPPPSQPPSPAPQVKPSTAPDAPQPAPGKATAPGEKPAATAEKAPLPRGAVLEEVSGTVRDIDRQAYKVEVDTAAGPVTLSLDRNTMVYTASGLATVLDVKPGAQIRAGRNADFLAYWVQVRTPAKGEPASTPAQGTGPAGGGGASVPSGDAGAGTGTAPPGTGAPVGGPSR